MYSANPKNNRNATFIEQATVKDLKNLTTHLNTYADVTKGMTGKLYTIKQIARVGVDTVLLNGNVHNRLYDTLKGKKVRYTIVKGEGA